MLYDVLIIGGGPGGYRAAERAGHAGLKVTLFEKRALGGVCLNEGCMPTKTLLYSAKLYDYAKGGAHKYGVDATGATIDHAAVIARKNKIVKTLVSGVAMQMKGAKVNVVSAEAVIKGRTANGFTVEANGEVFEGRNLIIAAGSNAVVPPIPGLKEAVAAGIAMTNREILDMTEKPASLLVMGGGVIGLEMVSYFNSIGTDVTVVEMLPKIAGATDADITKYLQAEYEKRGVKFLLSTKVVSVSGGSVEVESAAGKQTLKADKILVSTGRRANTAGLGCENIGLYLERGAIVTDEELKTNVPGVYAIGDVNGKITLAHTAYREGEVAVNVILGKKDRMNYNAIPSVIYTNPEVAAIGETSESAKKKALKFREVQLPMSYSGRYLAENEGGKGFIKLILDPDGVILGACAVGNPVSEIIAALAIAVERHLTCADLVKVVFPHPTVAEIFREAFLNETH